MGALTFVRESLCVADSGAASVEILRFAQNDTTKEEQKKLKEVDRICRDSEPLLFESLCDSAFLRLRSGQALSRKIIGEVSEGTFASLGDDISGSRRDIDS